MSKETKEGPPRKTPYRRALNFGAPDVTKVDSLSPTDSDDEEIARMKEMIKNKRMKKSKLRSVSKDNMSGGSVDLNKTFYVAGSGAVGCSNPENPHPLTSTSVENPMKPGTSTALVPFLDPVCASGGSNYVIPETPPKPTGVLQSALEKGSFASNFNEYYNIQSQVPKPIWSVKDEEKLATQNMDAIDVPFINFHNLRISFNFSNFDNLFENNYRCVGCPTELNAGCFPRLLQCMHSVCLICLPTFAPGFCPECLYFSEKTYPHFILNALTILNPKKANLMRPLCLKCKQYTSSYIQGDHFICKNCMFGFNYDNAVKKVEENITPTFVEYLKRKSRQCIVNKHKYSVIGYCATRKECFCPTCAIEYGEYKEGQKFELIGPQFIELAYLLPCFNFPGIDQLVEKKAEYMSFMKIMVKEAVLKIKTTETLALKKDFKKQLETLLEDDYRKLANAKIDYDNHLVEIFKLLHLLSALTKYPYLAFGVGKWMPVFVELVNEFASNRFYSNKSWEKFLPKFKHCPDQFNPRLRVLMENSYTTVLAVKRCKGTVCNPK